MCELTPGEVLVARLHEGPAAQLALATVKDIAGRYAARFHTNLAAELASERPPAWSEGHADFIRLPSASPPPFAVELVKVEPGAELSFVDELRANYLARVLDHPTLVPMLAADVTMRLAASPNWRLHPSQAGGPIGEPFHLGPHHARYLSMIGFNAPDTAAGAGTTIAVLGNGFNPQLWKGCPAPVTVTKGQDLLHGLARAVQHGADVITMTYSQFRQDKSCNTCGLQRVTARSEVFQRLLDWASGKGRRTILAAAGNNSYHRLAYPAAYRDVGVTAITALNVAGSGLASFANWDSTLPVLALPGEQVAQRSVTGEFYDGTSYATGYAAALHAVAIERSRRTGQAHIQTSRTIPYAQVPILV